MSVGEQKLKWSQDTIKAGLDNDDDDLEEVADRQHQQQYIKKTN